MTVQLIDNDKEAKIAAGDFSLTQAVHIITGNKDLNIRILGNHALLYIPVKDEIIAAVNDKSIQERYFTLEGVLRDHLTQEPIVYGTISVGNSSFGTIANQNGEFKLTLPDSLLKSTIQFSQLGYKTREIEASMLAGQHIVFYMDQKVIPLQEIVVRVVDPIHTIREMIARRDQNYSDSPVYLTTFYREGIEYKNSVNLIEAVFKNFQNRLSVRCNK